MNQQQFNKATADKLKLFYEEDDGVIYLFDPKKPGIKKFQKWDPYTDTEAMEALCEIYNIGVDKADNSDSWEAFNDTCCGVGETRMLAEVNCVINILEDLSDGKTEV